MQSVERRSLNQVLHADLVLWTVGSKPLLPQLESCDRPRDLPLNSRGQAETDETLRVKGHPRIFALGDSSALRDKSGKLLPATAQVFSLFSSFNEFFFLSCSCFIFFRDLVVLVLNMALCKARMHAPCYTGDLNWFDIHVLVMCCHCLIRSGSEDKP